MKKKRQVALDTETTGLNLKGLTHEGHNIIEIGAVEIIDRIITGEIFHVYVKPSRLIDKEAFKIHGISNNFLKDKPTFKQIVPDFINYIKNCELIIHNAAFDVGFINNEFKEANINIKLEDICCSILDTLSLSRKMYPKKNNKLEGLCARFNIDTSKRTLHSALLDAKLLAQVYLQMTSGQINLEVLPSAYEGHNLYWENNITPSIFKNKKELKVNLPLRILYPSKQELLKHEEILNFMQTNTTSLWLQQEKEKKK